MMVAYVLIGLLALGLVALYAHARARHLSLQADVDNLFEATRKRLRAMEDTFDRLDDRFAETEKKLLGAAKKRSK
jgi:hypothetical protein